MTSLQFNCVRMLYVRILDKFIVMQPSETLSKTSNTHILNLSKPIHSSHYHSHLQLMVRVTIPEAEGVTVRRGDSKLSVGQEGVGAMGGRGGGKIWASFGFVEDFEPTLWVVQK